MTEEPTQTKSVCHHLQVAFLPDDVDFNSARLQEQREMRQPGEAFWLKWRHTCLQCLEKIYVPKHLRRK